MNLRPYGRRNCPRFINLTSLIDVVFNLLIFFMVSTSFNRASEINVNLPAASTAQSSSNTAALEIVIDREGLYHLGDQTISDISTLIIALKSLAKDDLIRPLIIQADGQTPHQVVITAMDAARQVGLTRLSLATRQPLPAVSGGTQ